MKTKMHSMDTKFLSALTTSQRSLCSCDMPLVEWKSVEMMEDFLNNSFGAVDSV